MTSIYEPAWKTLKALHIVLLRLAPGANVPRIVKAVRKRKNLDKDYRKFLTDNKLTDRMKWQIFRSNNTLEITLTHSPKTFSDKL